MYSALLGEKQHTTTSCPGRRIYIPAKFPQLLVVKPVANATQRAVRTPAATTAAATTPTTTTTTTIITTTAPPPPPPHTTLPLPSPLASPPGPPSHHHCHHHYTTYHSAHDPPQPEHPHQHRLHRYHNYHHNPPDVSVVFSQMVQLAHMACPVSMEQHMAPPIHANTLRCAPLQPSPAFPCVIIWTVRGVIEAAHCFLRVVFSLMW